jgi:hypothetical protein
MPNLNGLSDFNLTADSQSNSVADDSEDVLTELLGNSIISDATKAKLLGEKIAEIEGAEGTSLIDRILSPEVLLPLLGGGAAAAFGGKGGAAFGGGLALGGLDNLTKFKELEKAHRQKAVSDLQDQQDKIETSLEKKRNRLATAINTNPELFKAPDGSVPDPETLGLLIFGEELGIYPQTRRLEQRRDKKWDAQLEFFTETLQKATTVEDAKPVVQLLFGHLGWDNASAGVIDNMTKIIGTPKFDTAFASTLLRWGGHSGLTAMRHAAENQLPLTHPDVLRKVKFTNQDSMQPSQVLTSKYIGLVTEVNEWQKENAEQAQSILDGADTPEEGIRQMADVVFSDRTGDKTVFLDKANLPANHSLEELLRAYGIIDKETSLASLIAQKEQLQAVKGMTSEQFKNWKMNNTVDFLDSAKQTAQENVGRQMASLRNKKRMVIAEALPGASDETIRLILNITMEGALDRAAKNPDGSVNVADWERIIDGLLPDMIKTYQEVQPNPQ